MSDVLVASGELLTMPASLSQALSLYFNVFVRELIFMLSLSIRLTPCYTLPETIRRFVGHDLTDKLSSTRSVIT